MPLSIVKTSFQYLKMAELQSGKLGTSTNAYSEEPDKYNKKSYNGPF